MKSVGVRFQQKSVSKFDFALSDMSHQSTLGVPTSKFPVIMCEV